MGDMLNMKDSFLGWTLHRQSQTTLVNTDLEYNEMPNLRQGEVLICKLFETQSSSRRESLGDPEKEDILDLRKDVYHKNSSPTFNCDMKRELIVLSCTVTLWPQAVMGLMMMVVVALLLLMMMFVLEVNCPICHVRSTKWMHIQGIYVTSVMPNSLVLYFSTNISDKYAAIWQYVTCCN